MRIAVFTTNDPRNYSGGRYHGLMLAYAASAAGIETVMITDHLPAFDIDLAPLSPDRKVIFHRTDDFRSKLPTGRFDATVIVPTGIFLPDFYESALAFAGSAGSLVALINFEAGNWFNTVAPEPKDIRLWSYWQRVLVDGGLCLSSARESAKWAKSFYRSRQRTIRHEVWAPAVNSTLARQYDGVAKNGSVLAFVRPMDRHKGSQDLLHLDPKLVRGRVLNLVAGREVDDEFEREIRHHFSTSEVNFHIRISDATKFQLMTQAQAVLFPSRFEGYGYPPVEAAYCGTESVCFRLAVLEETVGGIAHFAPMGDFNAFNTALAAALKQPERRAELRAAVEQIASFDHASELIAEILTRSTAVLPPRKPRPARVLVGPFTKTAPRKPTEIDRSDIGPPIPPIVTSARRTNAGDIAISVEATLPKTVTEITVAVESDLGCYCIPLRRNSEGDFVRWVVHVIVPPGAIGKTIRIVWRSPEDVGDEILIKPETIPSEPSKLATLFGSSEIKPTGQATRLRGWTLAAQPVALLHASTDGRKWYTAQVSTERRDIAEKHPGYPTRVCEFTVELAAGIEPKNGLIIALELNDTIVDVISGWMPTAKPLFQDGKPSQKHVEKIETPAKSDSPTVAAVPAPAMSEARPPAALKHPVILAVAKTTDDYWTNGILRKGSADCLATARVAAVPEAANIPLGTAIRFASGALRRVTRAETKGRYIEIGVDGPLNPRLDGGQPAETVNDKPAVTGEDHFVLSQWSDKNWQRGIWNLRGPEYRRSFFIRIDAPGAPRLRAGMLLSFAASGVRRISETRVEGKNLRVFLDGEIRPFGDGAPSPAKVLAPMTPFEEFALLTFVRGSDAKWRNGVLSDKTAEHGRVIRFAANGPGAQVRRGTVLRFASGALRRVLSVETQARRSEARLDRPIAVELDGAPSILSIADPCRLIDGMRPEYVFEVPKFAPSRSLFQIMIDEARRRGHALPPPPLARISDSSRVLVLSLVPHQPTNQGNRAVTRKLVEHLISLGFKVDLVIQNWVDPWIACEGMEDDLRVIALPFPEWQKTPAVAARKEIEAVLSQHGMPGVDEPIEDILRRTTKNFHPFFIARDEMVEVASNLLASNTYSAVVVNYTHLIRVLKELENRVPLPPSAVLTHDALSRLPTHFEQQKIDTAYRACPPELEAAALNAIEGMTVVAISRNEAEYFKTIGVRNPVVITEYDAYEEGEPYRVKPQSFASKTLTFHGSANPMNIAGLNWFIDGCWEQIREAVPDARLIVCGRICEAWAPNLPGIEIVGEVAREEMFKLLAQSTIAINPCVAGTGLKIKTVEAASIGLPSVCLPKAVDGLEDVSQEFALVADSAGDFAAACVRLLKDELAWNSLRENALRLARARFSREAVYAQLDAAMGWEQQKIAAASGDKVTAKLRPRLKIVDQGLNEEPDLSAAREKAEALTAELPPGPEPYIAAAELALRAKDGWQAAVHGAVVAALAPADAEGYRLMGEGFKAAGLRREAVDALQQAMMLRPGDPNLLQLLDVACTAAGDAAGSQRARSLYKRWAGSQTVKARL